MDRSLDEHKRHIDSEDRKYLRATLLPLSHVVPKPLTLSKSPIRADAVPGDRSALHFAGLRGNGASAWLSARRMGQFRLREGPQRPQRSASILASEGLSARRGDMLAHHKQCRETRLTLLLLSPRSSLSLSCAPDSSKRRARIDPTRVESVPRRSATTVAAYLDIRERPKLIIMPLARRQRGCTAHVIAVWRRAARWGKGTWTERQGGQTCTFAGASVDAEHTAFVDCEHATPTTFTPFPAAAGVAGTAPVGRPSRFSKLSLYRVSRPHTVITQALPFAGGCEGGGRVIHSCGSGSARFEGRRVDWDGEGSDTFVERERTTKRRTTC